MQTTITAGAVRRDSEVLLPLSDQFPDPNIEGRHSTFKTCCRCKLAKPLTAFHSNGHGRTRGACSVCESLRKGFVPMSQRPPKVPKIPRARKVTLTATDKLCSCCATWKPHIEFTKSIGNNAFDLSTYCRPCTAIKSVDKRSRWHPMRVRWLGMMNRCYSPKSHAFQSYGGRGITVCDEWHDFDTFASFWGNMPAPGLSMERMDVNGPYSPNNCRWGTPREQARNTTRTVVVEFAGEMVPLADMAEQSGVPRSTLVSRIRRMPMDDAISLPKGTHVAKLLEIDGVRRPISEWCAHFGIDGKAYRKRVAGGMAPIEALRMPRGKRGRPKKSLTA